MADEQIHLKWENRDAPLFDTLSSLWLDGKFSDVTLACQEKFFAAHKLVLIACSSYFRKILEHTICSSPVIVITDFDSDVIEKLIEYIYLGETTIHLNKVKEFTQAANRFFIKGFSGANEELKHTPKETESPRVHNMDELASSSSRDAKLELLSNPEEIEPAEDEMNEKQNYPNECSPPPKKIKRSTGSNASILDVRSELSDSNETSILSPDQDQGPETSEATAKPLFTNAATYSKFPVAVDLFVSEIIGEYAKMLNSKGANAMNIQATYLQGRAEVPEFTLPRKVLLGDYNLLPSSFSYFVQPLLNNKLIGCSQEDIQMMENHLIKEITSHINAYKLTDGRNGIANCMMYQELSKELMHRYPKFNVDYLLRLGDSKTVRPAKKPTPQIQHKKKRDLQQQGRKRNFIESQLGAQLSDNEFTNIYGNLKSSMKQFYTSSIDVDPSSSSSTDPK